MKYYPANLNIQNRNCLVVGGGGVGTRKVISLLDCGARVTVVSPDPTPRLKKLAAEGSIQLKERSYSSADLNKMFLVIGATDDENLNRRISTDAERVNILCNIADRPEVCNFILPAIVRRGDLTITISTSGKSPALAKRLRLDLEAQFGKEYADFLQLMGAIRDKLLSQAHAPEAHKALFNQLIDKDLIGRIKAGNTNDINALLHDVLGEGFNIEDLL
ncbi:MAG: bifunctional precorrin-2 dehydrogenase/sirohydrochlorin ferrochelatase [Deltaproteobacteria bacterium]|jgi:precorrin-2 dehydrogenase/sirohydrochlorin ferrochelatase|nr:bifunctional precorrin-2 dehydrogenase/sirohydrochlorin ferrochelatase [Deltaproteobacteria bacterium]